MMSNIWDVRHEFSQSMKKLLVAMRDYTDSLPQKLIKMQEIYLRKNAKLYSLSELDTIRRYLQAVIYKYQLASLSLEQLWAITDSKRLTVLDAVKNGADRLDYTDNELILSSFAFEGFLFQGRSFLDIYMIYLLNTLKTGHQGSMSFDRFFKELAKPTQEPFLSKSKLIQEYFTTRVFGHYESKTDSRNDWGQVLRSVRDKIAHKDVLQPSQDSNETLFGGVVFD